MLTDGLTLFEGSHISNMSVASGTSDPMNADAGELFFRNDLGTLRVYDGTAWSNLATGITAAGVNSFNTRTGVVALSLNDITAALGFTPASLDNNSKILSSQLPAIAITDTFIAASQTEMLALIAQTGDFAIRTDLNKSFILKGTNPSLIGDWQELLTPMANVSSVNGQTGAVTLSIDSLLPTQTSNSGKVLATNGAVAAWQTIDAPAAGALTGAVLSPNVVTSSLTTIGTLSSLTVTGLITTGGIEVGYRNLPRHPVIDAAAAGRRVVLSAGATIPLGFAIGDAFSLYNTTAATIIITSTGGVVMRKEGAAATVTTLSFAAYSTCLVWFNTLTEAIVSGNVA